MTQADKEQDNGKEKEKEREKEKEKDQQRGVKRPIAPPNIPEPLQEVSYEHSGDVTWCMMLKRPSSPDPNGWAHWFSLRNKFKMKSEFICFSPINSKRNL